MFVTLHSARKDIFGNLKSGDACKKRYEKWKTWYKSNNKKLKKSGSVAEYNEKIQILDDITQRSEIQAVKNTSSSQKDLLGQGKSMRDAAVGDWKVPGKQLKLKASPQPGLENVLMMLIEQKIGMTALVC